MFNKDQIRIYTYDDFKENNQIILKDIYNFLGVNNSFKANLGLQINESFMPNNGILYLLLTRRWKLYKTAKGILPTIL